MNNCVVYWLYDDGCICPWKHGYVGTTEQLIVRLRQHQKRFGDVQCSILFEGTKAQCRTLEWELRPAVNIGWNRSVGGKPSVNHTEDVRAKIREARTRQQFSHETREKLRIAALGRTNKGRVGQKKTAEERAKISASQTGRTFTPDHVAKLAAAKMGNKFRLGEKLSIESKQKISAKKRGMPIHSDEHKNKLRERMKGNAYTKGQPWSVARRLAWLSSKET